MAERQDTGGEAARVRALCDRLRAVLAETEVDFARMPIFVRPMVKRGFARRTGKSMDEWKGLVDKLRAGAGQGLTRAWLAARLPGLEGLLAALAENYRTAPERAARFMRDEALRREVRERSRRRQEVVHELLQAVRGLPA